MDGGLGADQYIFEAESAFDGVDTIRSFDQSEDTIDISDILIGYDPLQDAISDYVQITDDGTDSFIAVDTDGGADNFALLVRVEGVIDINVK